MEQSEIDKGRELIVNFLGYHVSEYNFKPKDPDYIYRGHIDPYERSWSKQIPIWAKLYLKHQNEGGDLIYSEEKRLLMIEILDDKPEGAFQLLVKILSRLSKQ